MDAHVWIGTKSRWNIFQSYEEGTLTLDGETLTFAGSGGPVVMNLSEIEFRKPRTMTGLGFVMKVRGITATVYFSDPAASRTKMLEGGDENEVNAASVTSLFQGRKAAKPWLQTLRARGALS